MQVSLLKRFANCISSSPVLPARSNKQQVRTIVGIAGQVRIVCRCPHDFLDAVVCHGAMVIPLQVTLSTALDKATIERRLRLPARLSAPPTSGCCTRRHAENQVQLILNLTKLTYLSNYSIIQSVECSFPKCQVRDAHNFTRKEPHTSSCRCAVAGSDL